MIVLNDEQNRRRIREQADKDQRELEVKQKAQAVNQANTKLGVLRIELGRLQREFTSKDTRLKGMKSAVEADKRNIATKNSSEQTKKREAGRLKDGLTNLDFKLRKVKTDLATDEAKLRSDHLEEKRIEDEIRSMNAKIAGSIPHAMGTQSSLDNKEREDEARVRELEAEVNELNRKIDRKNQEIEDTKNKIR